MNSMEIVLLIIGALVFVASFLIPGGKGDSPVYDRELAEDEISALVSKELERIRDQVDDRMEEAIKDSMDRTERSLERLSNEKIMAVSEYSETVLGQINKSHQEITFLYDMLNAKHDSLKNTASEVERKIKAAETAGREVEAVTREAETALREAEAATQMVRHVVTPAFQALQTVTVETEEEEEAFQPEQVPEEEICVQSQQELQGAESYNNKNDRILELHRQGWSDVTIAKQLDLGVGEVKLVIDLFEGRND
ncbi:MAG: hypothetical protein K2L18_03995 [Acetatifactor sp.]|nr:hypothetical protein [Acetatifactor sp.]